MIGNAVPVKLAEYVATKLNDYIKSQEEVEFNKDSFIGWLINVQNFTPRTASDTLSRVRRADRICRLDGVPNDFYCYSLQQKTEYVELSTSVRSQIKRALSLYNSFIRESNKSVGV